MKTKLAHMLGHVAECLLRTHCVHPVRCMASRCIAVGFQATMCGTNKLVLPGVVRALLLLFSRACAPASECRAPGVLAAGSFQGLAAIWAVPWGEKGGARAHQREARGRHGLVAPAQGGPAQTSHSRLAGTSGHSSRERLRPPGMIRSNGTCQANPLKHGAFQEGLGHQQ